MLLRHLALVLSFFLAVTVSIANANAQPDRHNLESIVDRHAEAHGLPKQFARAVVKVESTWNPRLTGAAGEVGLMQIKFETARHLGYRGTRRGLYEPSTNVKWAMKYLAGAWKLAGGDKCGTVLRYQAGHGAKTMTNAARTYCERLRRFMVASG
jgi:soluble lytic murein transglycosylase-like protein